jgi:hypothetical protein
MMNPSDSKRDVIERYFAGLAESTFHTRLGVADPILIDYVTELLVRFVRLDAIHRMRNLRGEPMLQIGELLAEAKQRLGDARREIHQHIGDFTLFWIGLFPEAVNKKTGPDAYQAYCTHGKLSYKLASEIETTDEKAAPGELLERLSDRFELCAYGIREVRREWENHNGDDRDLPFLLN